MRIIIPMAGKGKRMRPHTLVVPKPLIRLAGKPIVQRIVESIAAAVPEKIEEIAFVTGDFGKEVEASLLRIAQDQGARGTIYHQAEALGTAHAVDCARESLEGPVVVAFADTLFRAEFTIPHAAEAVIWTSKVNDPSAFGVVVADADGVVTRFVEKPEEFVSDQAIIGIYYFRDGSDLRRHIRRLIEAGRTRGGEYQLTDTLIDMMQEGTRFHTAAVEEWLDCGNKDAVVHTNQRILEHQRHMSLISPRASVKDSIIIHPCYIADGAEIISSIIGPHVSIEQNTHISHSIVTNTIIQDNARISNANLDNSMIGSSVEYKGKVHDASIGDYTVFN